MSHIKIGDVVAWADVPDGALVLHMCHLYERHGRWGCTRAYWNGERFSSYAEGWIAGYQWSDLFDDDEPRIVALGLTGQESAADLRRLAEVFEVREALDRLLVCPYCNNEEPTIGELEDGTISQPWCTECDTEMGEPHFADEAERLHAAGWRPGMTAEDAARLLAQTGP